jgi:hypothetical protein
MQHCLYSLTGAIRGNRVQILCSPSTCLRAPKAPNLVHQVRRIDVGREMPTAYILTFLNQISNVARSLAPAARRSVSSIAVILQHARGNVDEWKGGVKRSFLQWSKYGSKMFICLLCTDLFQLSIDPDVSIRARDVQHHPPRDEFFNSPLIAWRQRPHAKVRPHHIAHWAIS